MPETLNSNLPISLDTVILSFYKATIKTRGLSGALVSPLAQENKKEKGAKEFFFKFRRKNNRIKRSFQETFRRGNVRRLIDWLLGVSAGALATARAIGVVTCSECVKSPVVIFDISLFFKDYIKFVSESSVFSSQP